jgi:hypothetical protein
MRRFLVLACLLPSLALAQSTRVIGPNGSGGTDTAKVTTANGLQIDVTRVQGANTTASGTVSTACSGGTSCAGTSYVTIAMLGKSTAGMQVSAISSPSGITVQCDISLDGGTTWSQAATGNCQFDNSKTLVKSSTIASFTVGDSYQLVMSGGVTNVRVRASALTSGTVTISVTGSDTEDPSELFGSPGGATSMPPAVAVVGAQDATTSTTVNPVRSQAPASAATTVPGLVVMDFVARTASPAYTATHFGHPSMDVTGSQLVMVGQAGGSAAAVKAASTAAVATDPALVVAQSPNGGNPCQNPNATLAMVAGQTSGTSSTQLIALNGSTKIYVCSMTIQGISGTTPTFALRYGTGTACATGTVTIIGAFTTTANATYVWAGPSAFVTIAGQALCYIQTGTTPIANYAITYVQQ